MKIKWKKKWRYIDVKFENPYNNYNLRKNIYHQYLSIFVSFSDRKGAHLDRLRHEVFQNLFYSPINTGFLRPAVATVPTVYGIETLYLAYIILYVLNKGVATVPTVYGIETINIDYFNTIIYGSCNSTYRLRYWNAGRKLRYGNRIWSCNSTYRLRYWNHYLRFWGSKNLYRCNSTYRLRYWNRAKSTVVHSIVIFSCNSTYRLRYWNE